MEKFFRNKVPIEDADPETLFKLVDGYLVEVTEDNAKIFKFEDYEEYFYEVKFP